MSQIESKSESYDGVTITPISGFSLIHIATRGNRKTAASGVKREYGAAAPMRPNTVGGKDDTLIMWFGPKSWIVRTADKTLTDLPTIKLCSVTDLSDSRCQFRIEGSRAVELLSTGCPVDFDATMAMHGCAQTTYNHFQIFLHRSAEETYDVFVPRSFAEDFWREITTTAKPL